MLFLSKKRKITVQEHSVNIIEIDGQDYICLTDMVRHEDGADYIRNWLRNRNTIEFLGLWEGMNNPDFKGVEFDRFRSEAGLNSFNLTPKKWIEATGAIGIISKSGRYGGTYAHRDIAFEFCTWISPVFKLYLIKEYQRLKDIEANQYNLEWSVNRIITKANYHIHTDAVKTYLIPASVKWKKDFEYAEEADLLNVALFGCTAKEWRERNPQVTDQNVNIRDQASINELVVMSNLQSLNAHMIRDGISKRERFEKLQAQAQHELKVLGDRDWIKAIKKTSHDVYLIETKTDKQ